MPTQISSSNPGVRQAARQRATEADTLNRVNVRSPWEGFVPDLDPNRLGGSSAVNVQGLVAFGSPDNQGEVLRLKDGHVRIDSPRLPLTDSTGTAARITLLGELLRHNATGVRTGTFDLTGIATTEGLGGADGRVWTLNPATDQWLERSLSADAGSAGHTLTAEIDGAGSPIQSMPVGVAFPAGAPNRPSGSGAINQPVFVWTNNSDPVYTFPEDSVGGGNDNTYGVLHTGALDVFLARCVESFQNRLYFGNTSEAGSRFSQRVRRTAIGEADPDASLIGSGATDLIQFDNELVRLLTLGQVMAVYMEDGVAFLVPTGNVNFPDSFRVLTKKRGLLSSHSVVAISGNTHFGIFSDGWWLLDSNGRWTQLGVTEVDGKTVHKWRQFFFNTLDMDNRHRIQVEYDPQLNHIHIVMPITSDTETTEVWVYELFSDRVWRERYDTTVWGNFTIQQQAATLWNSASIATNTWANIGLGSWASFGARFGIKTLIHATSNGLVFLHDDGVITRDGNNPSWAYETILSDLGQPYTLKTLDRLGMSHVNANNSAATTLEAFGSGASGSAPTATETINTDQRNVGDIETSDSFFRLTDNRLGFRASGTHPTLIRSFEADVFVDPTERRNS